MLPVVAGQPGPALAVPQTLVLLGIACPNVSTCVAVGATPSATAAVTTLHFAADSDLAIATPADVTTAATGANGAKVTFTPPAVTDEGATTITPTCSSSGGLTSGSTFPVGTTTVTCTASSADDVVAVVTSSFTVMVQGASAQLVALTQAVQGVGPGTSLSGKLAQVQAYVAAGDITDACGTLGAFIHEVTSLSGRSITTAAAAQLIADAQRIEATLSC